MPASKAQQRAVSKYIKDNYDEIKVRVPKGKKLDLQTYLSSKGETLNSFINRAIDETIRHDLKKY